MGPFCVKEGSLASALCGYNVLYVAHSTYYCKARSEYHIGLNLFSLEGICCLGICSSSGMQAKYDNWTSTLSFTRQ